MDIDEKEEDMKDSEIMLNPATSTEENDGNTSDSSNSSQSSDDNDDDDNDDEYDDGYSHEYDDYPSEDFDYDDDSDVDFVVDPLEIAQKRDVKDQSWIVQELKPGDKIEIFDEEMGWWETGTIKDIDENVKEFSFEFDQNMDSQWPNNDISVLRQDHCSVEDFEHARFPTYTIESCKPLLLPTNVYIPRDQIIRVFDVYGVEWLFLGAKRMNNDNDNNDNDNNNNNDRYSSKSHLMLYNCNTDKFQRISNSDVIYNVPGNRSKAYHHFLLRSGNIDNYVKKLLKMDKAAVFDKDIGIQTVLVPQTNTVHLLCQNKSMSCHALLPLFPLMYPKNKNTNSQTIPVPGYRTFGGNAESNLNRPNGKLIYISRYNNLMYFGGFDANKGCYSKDIWYLDLDENEKTAKWRLYDLSLPQPNDNDFNVVFHGGLVFLFYTTGKRNIYIYDLINLQIWRSSKRFPGPYKGKAIAIKTDNTLVHFFNGSQDKDNINMKRPYHFKMRLDELIPSELWPIHTAKYKKLTEKYLYHHLHEYNQDLSLQLVGTVMKYFPIFA